MKHFRYYMLVLIFVFLVLMMAGCDPQARGFALPEGRAEAGQEAFQRLGCQHCHSIVNQLEKNPDGHPDIHFKIGGTTTRVHTYGDLVTSIINPNHRISGYAKAEDNVDEEGNSMMPSHNEFMTVQELVDLTTYLETTYEVVRPEPHGMYYP